MHLSNEFGKPSPSKSSSLPIIGPILTFVTPTIASSIPFCVFFFKNKETVSLLLIKYLI
ncbi:uncharacterized protein Dvar_36490 [Desulfosarcina variabilis str. Montpellier]